MKLVKLSEVAELLRIELGARALTDDEKADLDAAGAILEWNRVIHDADQPKPPAQGAPSKRWDKKR